MIENKFVVSKCKYFSSATAARSPRMVFFGCAFYFTARPRGEGNCSRCGPGIYAFKWDAHNFLRGLSGFFLQPNSEIAGGGRFSVLIMKTTVIVEFLWIRSYIYHTYIPSYR